MAEVDLSPPPVLMTAEQRSRLQVLRILVQGDDWHWRTGSTKVNLVTELTKLEYLEKYQETLD